MLSRRDLAAAIFAVGRLLRLRADAFDYFDSSLGGFWKSFWAAAFVLPLWALMLSQEMAAAEPASPARYVVVQAIGYAISWLAYPLLMVRISQFLGRWPRYFTYLVAYNWFQLIQAVAWLPLLLMMESGVAPRGAVGLVWLTTHAVLLGYGWFIARRGLEVEGGTAAALVVIDFLLSLLIDGVTSSLT